VTSPEAFAKLAHLIKACGYAHQSSDVVLVPLAIDPVSAATAGPADVRRMAEALLRAATNEDDDPVGAVRRILDVRPFSPTPGQVTIADRLLIGARLLACDDSETRDSFGVPKTIDNDISGTDQTFGFDTAVMIATEAVDRIHTTADSHNRVVVVEVMGRDAGWIAYAAGTAGGAHVTLVPEKDIDIDHVCKLLKYNYDHGKHYGVVVVAEGCHLPEVGQVINENAQLDSFGHARLSGIGEKLAELIEKKTGFETRSVNLGHTQRGGVPTAYDRILGQRYGLHAIDMVHEKKWGRIAVLQGLDITDIPIKDAIATNRRLDQRFFDVIANLEAKV
jgi:6-phosphofructokinase